MKKLAAIVGALCLLLGPAAHADRGIDMPGSSKYIEGWNLAGYAHDGEFTHCSMYAHYIDGMTLYFSMQDDQEWALALYLEKPGFTKGRTTDLSLKIDDLPPLSLQASARSEQLIHVKLPSTEKTYRMVWQGRRLSLETDGMTFDLDLDGMKAAFPELLKCVARNAPTDAADDKAVPAGKADKVTAAQRLEEKKIVDSLFARRDMAGLRVMDAKEIFYLKNGWLSRTDVAWMTKDLVGTLRVFPAKIDPSALMSAIIKMKRDDCQKGFESASTPDERSPSVLRWFTRCLYRETITMEGRYLLVPGSGGTHYLFTTIGQFKTGEPSDHAVKEDSILRQAVYEVMKQ